VAPPASRFRTEGVGRAGGAGRAVRIVLAAGLVAVAMALGGCGDDDDSLQSLRDRGDRVATSLQERADELIARVESGELDAEAAVQRVTARARAIAGRARAVAQEEIARLESEAGAGELSADARREIDEARRDVEALAGSADAARAGVEEEADEVEAAIRARGAELAGEVREGTLTAPEAAQMLADDARDIAGRAAEGARADLERIKAAADDGADELSRRLERARERLEEVAP
jgi:hypothetical protein